ncbi:glycosyltransferase [Vibrio cholerae]
MNKYPKVSVITFAYVSSSNGRYDLLRECIESIKNQNYPNYEHIIIDDGSDLDLSHLEIEYSNVKYYKKVGSGIISSTYTFNIGHKLATGKYCIYLPSDDLHVENAIINLVTALEKESEASMAIGKAIYESIDGKVTSWSPDKDKIENYLHEGNYINGCAVMWKRTDILYKYLPPNYTGFCCDYDLWATISKLGKIIYPDVDVVKYRHVSDSTRNKTRSSFIVSPRKEDKAFYQYSKESRVEFVKIRYQQDLNKLDDVDIQDVEFENSRCISLPDNLSNSLVKIVKKRNWNILDDYFSRNNLLYKKLKDELNNNNSIIIFEDVNIITSCLIRQLNKCERIYILNEFSLTSWIVDYLPIPLIKGVVSKDRKLDNMYSTFLGI